MDNVVSRAWQSLTGKYMVVFEQIDPATKEVRAKAFLKHWSVNGDKTDFTTKPQEASQMDLPTAKLIAQAAGKHFTGNGKTVSIAPAADVLFVHQVQYGQACGDSHGEAATAALKSEIWGNPGIYAIGTRYTNKDMLSPIIHVVVADEETGWFVQSFLDDPQQEFPQGKYADMPVEIEIGEIAVAIKDEPQ